MGGLDLANKAWNWKDAGVYVPLYDEKTKALTKLKFNNKVTVDVRKEFGINSAWKLACNWDVFSACFVLDPMPPVKCITFFPDNLENGPRAVPAFTGKPKELQIKASTTAVEVSRERKQRAEVNLGSTSTKDKLKMARVDKSKECMKLVEMF